jgi:predicted dehydrogenase
MRPKTPVTAFVASNHTPARSAATVRGTSRRSFLGGTVATTCAAAGTLPTGLCFAAGEQRLRIGLVGCGGRGTGAALQALEADPSVRVVALGDVFADQVASAADVLGRASGRFDCPPLQRFVGPDAYRRVIDSGVDVVLLAAPPHTRPLHLEAAVAAGKHVYCEQPVAVDAAGVVRVAAAAARSRAAGLAVVSGFCFRRDDRMVEIVSRLHDGAIGMPRLVQAHAAIGLPWRKPADGGRAAGEWPLRNWISFTRYSGGHFVTHHVQAIDRAAWILGDVAPLTAEGMAGSSCPASGAHDTTGNRSHRRLPGGDRGSLHLRRRPHDRSLDRPPRADRRPDRRDRDRFGRELRSGAGHDRRTAGLDGGAAVLDRAAFPPP